MITYPQIDPIAFQIGPLAIRWYGLAYIAGILLAFKFAHKDLSKKLGLSEEAISNLMLYIVFGIILGGRLGYVLFYDLFYYLSTPSDIIALWKGGMSYHGGALGALTAMVIFGKRHNVSILSLLDLLGISSTIGIFFGRIANFINGELYGRVTEAPWAMVFPTGGPFPRHPSQLYEALFEGILLFVILYYIKTRRSPKPGTLFCLYLALYGCFRFCIEFFRQPDTHIGTLFLSLSLGQYLCLLMIFLSFYLKLLIKKPK